ncbi:ATP-binding protein [Clostridium tyrobutyricum]|uniref:ATP-binding protein n=1 Tax=Clostridium tyrobutyricum TaxID=1519 RepID=UPI00189E3D43|nr:ATP-binding protein [Clostridium tyrobutyricum]
MKNNIITPKVDETQEFIEIAFDFSNPLDLVREAISNAFDAGANEISISFSVKSIYGEKILIIEIKDNGQGMDMDGLRSFFDLGNSLRRGDDKTIGEKGHGTKVYFNSKKIEVKTIKDSHVYYASMDEPSRKLFDREIPLVNVKIDDIEENKKNGTFLTITGYNNNRRDKFTHQNLKDYIMWFTKMGSIEQEFGIIKNSSVTIKLKGIDESEFETLSFGHFFPKDSKKVSDLFEDYLVQAPKRYCKKLIKTGNLKNFPEIKYQAVFCIEGTKVKYDYNPMIRRSGYNAPPGAYTVQDRYGLWVCKDYMPIQRKNEWITQKGSEYTKFHAFINCQDLKLTANRGSVDNTPSEILQDLKEVVVKFYNEITQSSEWKDIAWLESEVDAYNTVEKEKKDFKWRIDKINHANVAIYKGIKLIEPKRESGVFTLYLQLETLDKSIFPFTVIDYDTHSGIDVIVKEKNSIPIKSSKLYYVEFKNFLEKQFNHSFENLHSIICWDIDSNNLKNGDEVTDIGDERRTLKIIPPANSNDYTRYYLDHIRSNRKIEIFVLKDYLKQKYNIQFRPRLENDCE